MLLLKLMANRCRCPSCNRNDTYAGYFCEKCFYNWEEEAYFEPDGSITKSNCPRCLKLLPAETLRCANPACMAVWAPPEPD